MPKVIKVAIADDYDTLRVAMRRFLEQFPDVKVIGEAKDGAEALQLVQSCPVDVLLLDLVMPGVSGREVLQQLKATTPGVAAIVLSGLPAVQWRDNVLAAGAWEYLEKDCEPEAIIAAVRGAAGFLAANDPN